ncbi:DUF4192 family protein [Pseudarthrobacter sp. NPDC058329]|uniref:DUF4192 family protein n=1 Tax=Pseudarthrobacter sp. NPDC058329 TaxID=3346448 RepID=UPI0036DB8F89
MTPPERLTVRGPEDILGFIPHSLGYWPAQSLVAMTMQGKRLGATLRLDLPGPAVLADPTVFAQTVCGYLEADENADGTLLALFTNNGWLAGPDCYDALLDSLEWALAEAGMPVKDAWYVGDQYWRDVRCRSGCCPLPGRPVQEIRDSLLNTEMVFRGSSVGPAPEQRQPACPVPDLQCDAVREAEAVWSAQLDPRRQSRAQFDAVLGQWEAVLARPAGHLQRPSVHRDAFLRATLMIPAWRDAVLVMAAAGRAAAAAGAEEFGIFSEDVRLGPLAPAAEQAGAEQTPFAADAADYHCFAADNPCVQGLSMPEGGAGTPGYGDVLMGHDPAVPQWHSLDALDLVLEHLAVPGGPPAAAALTGRGWIAWCRGRGSYAAAYLDEALESEPGYRLAELLLEMVRRGALCGWAARKEAAWQKFGPDAA